MFRNLKNCANRKQPIDVKHLERLVKQLLTTDYSIPWYSPDGVELLPWADIKESFMGGYNFALNAVLKGLRGDGGTALQRILDHDVVIVRPDDKQEYEEKLANGAPVIRLF